MNKMDFEAFRGDVLAKVTGKARYSGDVHMEGMLHAKAVRLPVPRAKIIQIDTSKAEEVAGVARVITRADICGPNNSGRVGNHVFDQPILVGVGENTENMGDAVALVVADSEDIAARAANLVKIKFEELPAIHTWQEAVAAGRAPACSRNIIKGDVAMGFAAADVIIEDNYFTPLAEHAYIEPEAGLAYMDEDGRLNIRVGTQAVRQQMSMVCEALGLPYDKVRIYTPYIGGGFGGKHSMTVHVHLGLLAMLMNRPVRMVWSREESVCFSCKKQSFDTKVKLGLDKEGHITAFQAEINGPTSPYTGKSLGRLSNFMNFMLGPYRHPNLEIKGQMFNTTVMEIGAFRGVAGPDGSFVIETLMNKAAKVLGISPLEIRKRNWFKTNQDIAGQFNGCLARNFSKELFLEETLGAALEEAGVLKAEEGKLTGRGFACAMPSYAGYNSDNQCNTKAMLTMNLDGTFTARLSFPELGQGITAMADALFKKELGGSAQEVSILLSDSDKTPIGGELGFSLATVNAGAALLDACINMKKEMAKVAGMCLSMEPALITYLPQEKAFADQAGQIVLNWDAFKKYCFVRVINPTVIGHVDTRLENRNEYAVTPVACVADVAVDEETGELQVRQLIQCHDIGKVIHYASARGQLLGASVMAMGTTLMEEYLCREGKSLTPSLAEYLIPTAMDIPGVSKALFLENNPSSIGPYGAKGLGEHGMYTVNAAIANAIAQATGKFITQQPITSEKILKALGKI